MTKTLEPTRRKVIFAGSAILGIALLVPTATALASIPQPNSAPAGLNFAGHKDRSWAVRSAIDSRPAKNVILLIGDGMGDSEITIGRNYEFGAGGRLPGIDALPLTGHITTYSVYKDGEFKGKPDYTPDSSATGTAWATGNKTYDKAVSVDIDGKALPTLIEIARANGLKTGNVSTAEIQDATPAVQVAHVASRNCYGWAGLDQRTVA